MKTRLSVVIAYGTICLLLLAIEARGQNVDDFQSLFNGRDLTGWDGDNRFWSVVDGAIVGQTSEDNQAEQNTFLIYREKEFGDFELRFSYQVEGYNSGVQYRSTDLGNYVVGGYQADFEAQWHPAEPAKIDRFSGMFFEEKGRGFLGQRGQVVLVKSDSADAQKHVVELIGSLGDPNELERAIVRDGWNEFTVVAQGFQFTHIINGRTMAIGMDEDEGKRRATGILAFQLHSGPPMTIRLKEIRIREIR